MGIYDRDYMREKNNKGKVINFKKSGSSSNENKYLIAIIVAFIIGVIVGKMF